MITSSANAKVKRIVSLQEKSRNRVKENVFIAEGIKMFEEAPLSSIKEIYIEEHFAEQFLEEKLQETMHKREGIKDKLKSCKNAGTPIETVTEEIFAKMSDTRTPQGILCVLERQNYDVKQLIAHAKKKRQKTGQAPLFLLLEDIQDPGNLGTMIRTAEGAGADGVIMSKGTVDIYNPKTIRSTMGSLYRVPFVYADVLSEIITLLQKEEITVYAAHLNGEKYFHQFSYKEGAAFLIGNEGNGLKKETADLADIYLKIPMEGQLESLNAAVAAALLMYQVAINRYTI